MSGDSGLNETVVFYSKEMTQAKLIVLQHKGIQLAYKSLKDYLQNHFRVKKLR